MEFEGSMQKPRKIRVAHVDHTVVSGGAEIALARLVNSEPGWEPYLFVPRGSDRSEMLARANFMDVVEAGPQQKPGLASAGLRGALLFSGALASHALALTFSRRFRSVDIVHANSTRAALYSVFAAKLSRKPLIVHLRDAVSSDSLGQIGYRAMTKLVLPAARGVVANSQYTLGTAREHVAAGVVARVIPSAVGLPRRTAPTHERSEVLTIGMVARVAEWKGQRLVLEAFARAFQTGPVRLSFVGGTELGGSGYFRALRSLADSLGVSSRVNFLGQVPSGEVEALIDDLDICVQASIRPEPLGQNVLQYLARARPTVVADRGGPVEWIRDGHNGRTFRSGDVEDLARVLKELEPREQREALARGASQTPLPTLESVAAMHHDMYVECMRP